MAPKFWETTLGDGQIEWLEDLAADTKRIGLGPRFAIKTALYEVARLRERVAELEQAIVRHATVTCGCGDTFTADAKCVNCWMPAEGRLEDRIAKADDLAKAVEALENFTEHREDCPAPSRVSGATECPCGAIEACIAYEAALAAHREAK